MNNEEIIWDDDVQWDNETPTPVATQPTQLPQPKEEGFLSGVFNDLKGGVADARNVQNTGNFLLDNYNRTGALAGGVNKVIGRGLRSAYKSIVPENIQKDVSFLGNEIMQSPVGDALKGVGSSYDKFAQSQPDVAQFVESTANIGGLVPTGYGLKGAKEAIKEGVNVARDTKKILSLATDEGLQKGLSDTYGIVSSKSQKAQIVPNRVKSAMDMEKFYKAEDLAVRQIVKDKETLSFMDANGAVIKKQLPETVDEWNQAIPQIKEKVLSQTNKLIKNAEARGGIVSTQPVVDTLKSIKNSDLYSTMAQHPQYDSIRKSIDTMIERYGQKGKMTLSEVNADIQAMNKLVGSQVDPLADLAMFDVLKTQRKALDDTITNLSGSGFSDLKKTWGALKEIEPRVAQKANALSRESGRLNFWDIASLTEGTFGLMSLNPKVVAMAMATKGSKEIVKRFNDPNRYVKNMFKKVEDKMNPEYKSRTGKYLQSVSKTESTQLPKSPYGLRDTYNTNIQGVPENFMGLRTMKNRY